jgi:DNA segregation ATPase FtsK/SpoIIIE-like protein
MKIPIIFFTLEDWQKNRKKVIDLMLKNLRLITETREGALKEVREKLKTKELQEPVIIEEAHEEILKGKAETKEYQKEDSPEKIKAEAERYKQRIARIEFHESRLIEEVKKQNSELRKIIKRFGWLGVLPFIILAIITKQNNWLLGLFVFIAICVGFYLFGKYHELNNRNIITCDSCFREFVPKENDSDKECPYCGQRHSANYV